MKRFLFVTGGCALVGIAVWLYGRGGAVPVYESAKVARGNLSHVVSVTGHLEPVDRLTLAFPVGGRVSSLADEGARVMAGTELARLEQDQSLASVSEAQARLLRERATRAELAAPQREEDRAVLLTTLSGAEQALAAARDAARATLAHAFSLADGALHEDVDSVFENVGGSSPRFGIRFVSGTTKYPIQASNEQELRINEGYHASRDRVVALQVRSTVPDSEIARSLADADGDLVVLEAFLNDLAEAVNRYVSTDVSEQAVYETFQTAIASARSAVSTARTEVAAASTAYRAADTAHETARVRLAQADAGASQEALLVQDAAVHTAERAVETAQARLADTVLEAPFSGTVTRVMKNIGETVGPYESVVELLTEGAYEVEAYIPEADIARVKPGDRASITFDALERSMVFTASVSHIALSETVREGVPTYKTNFSLDMMPDAHARLRPGMTASIDLTTDVRENVLYLPVRSVAVDGERTFVRTWDGAAFVEHEITTGLRGSDGTIEVVSGLSEGEEVVLYVKEEKA